MIDLPFVSHCVDNFLTEEEARLSLNGTLLRVTWFTNEKNEQSVVHSHPYHELVFPMEGSMVRYSVNGSVYMLHLGETIYFPAQMYHSGKFNVSEPVSERLVVQIDDALWQASRRRASLTNADWMRGITVLDKATSAKYDISGLFLRMARAAQTPAEVRNMIFEAEVTELILLITQAVGTGQPTIPSSTSVLVSRAVAYLQVHYQEPTLTTSILAQELYASREHLSRAFKECTMESIHSYLTHLRMQHCCRALADGATVLDACSDSGFPDYSSFLKTFRRLYGITPAEFRAKYRESAR